MTTTAPGRPGSASCGGGRRRAAAPTSRDEGYLVRLVDSVSPELALVDPEHNCEPMNEVYKPFFKDPLPARSYFGATGFRHAGQLLQIDCIAYID